MKLQFHTLLPHIVLITAAVLILVGLFVLVRSEEQKTRDTIRMQEIIGIKQGLYRYYLNHAAYPAADQPVHLGSQDATCLHDKGFVSHTSHDCTVRAYLLPVPSGYLYTPRAEQGDEPCISTIGCPRYAITFQLETNVFASKGMHALTPEGMK